jgi:pimeloyl-ACP methyl ester carboxylesterase
MMLGVREIDMADEITVLAQRSQQKLHFDHKDMDYYLAWIMGREIYDGSRADECRAVVTRIPNGDPVAWHREWQRLAETVEAEAKAALADGHQERAKGAYLRACTYYRAPLFMMRATDPALRPLAAKMQACFRAAMALFAQPIETVSVAFRGERLPGYFWQVDASGARRPTLVIIGGIETFAEDCYFMVGPAGPVRGYNVLAVDLPGQGLTPDRGLVLEARMGPAIEAVMTYALGRAEVDPLRLALFGFSWGGHVVMKGAEHDRRIRALIANPAMPDVFRAAWAQQANHGRGGPIGLRVIDQIAWRMGLSLKLTPRNIARRFAKIYDYLFRGRAKVRAIACPVLCLAGEGEAKITLDIARAMYSQLTHPRKLLRIFTRAEGGEAHCQVNNLALPNRVIFDWLDDVFAA